MKRKNMYFFYLKGNSISESTLNLDLNVFLAKIWKLFSLNLSCHKKVFRYYIGISGPNSFEFKRNHFDNVGYTSVSRFPVSFEIDFPLLIWSEETTTKINLHNVFSFEIVLYVLCKLRSLSQTNLFNGCLFVKSTYLSSESDFLKETKSLEYISNISIFLLNVGSKMASLLCVTRKKFFARHLIFEVEGTSN